MLMLKKLWHTDKQIDTQKDKQHSSTDHPELVHLALNFIQLPCKLPSCPDYVAGGDEEAFKM